MRRIIIAPLLLLASISMAAAQHSSTYFAPDFPGKIYNHNGSTMDVKIHRGLVEITYIFPRAGLPDSVEMGTVLSTGSFDPVLDQEGNFVRFTLNVTGIAYIFSSRCGEIPYEVKGWFEEDFSHLTLLGLVPILDHACHVIGSTLEHKDAILVFNRDTMRFIE